MIVILLKNKINKDKIEALLLFIKALNIEEKLKREYLFKERKKVEFTLSEGLWKDYSMDGNQLRKQSWNIS